MSEEKDARSRFQLMYDENVAKAESDLKRNYAQLATAMDTLVKAADGRAEVEKAEADRAKAEVEGLVAKMTYDELGGKRSYAAEVNEDYGKQVDCALKLAGKRLANDRSLPGVAKAVAPLLGVMGVQYAKDEGVLHPSVATVLEHGLGQYLDHGNRTKFGRAWRELFGNFGKMLY